MNHTIESDCSQCWAFANCIDITRCS